MTDARELLRQASKMFLRWAENTAPGGCQLPPAGVVNWLEDCDALLSQPAPEPAPQAGLNNYVQPVPPHCDRIVWRGKFYGLPISPQPSSQQDAPPSAEVPALTFAAFRAANVARCVKWHPAGIESWSPSDWLTAVTGELGELASLLKMRNRERDGLPGNKFSPTDKQVADELADVLTYLDLLAAMLGIDLGRAAVEKFNEVSARVGFPDRIDLGATPPSAEVPALRAALAAREQSHD